jgi:hypothetical protein
MIVEPVPNNDETARTIFRQVGGYQVACISVHINRSQCRNDGVSLCAYRCCDSCIYRVLRHVLQNRSYGR